MINITLESLVNCTDGLKGLSQKPLKARSAYIIGKIIKAADTEMIAFNEARLELIKKYGEKKDNGDLNSDENGNVRIPVEFRDNFNKEMQELLETPVEINANKIKLEDIKNVEFTPTEMAQLDDFIEFDE